VPQKATLIVIGKLLRPHGISREGVSHFKMSFDIPGHETLPKSQSVWISHQDDFIEVPLAESASPLGGKWTHATGAKLSFRNESLRLLGDDLIGRQVALERSRFAPLADNEVYLCDLIGAEVRGADGVSHGHIESATSAGHGAWNLGVRPLAKNSKSFEFPLKWIDWENSTLDPQASPRWALVPGIETWMDLEALEGDRDDD
jgi:ribosomal 30S subunit maturation factor RimM